MDPALTADSILPNISARTEEAWSAYGPFVNVAAMLPYHVQGLARTKLW